VGVWFVLVLVALTWRFAFMSDGNSEVTSQRDTFRATDEPYLSPPLLFVVDMSRKRLLMHRVLRTLTAAVVALAASAALLAQKPSPSEAIVPFRIQVPDAVLKDLSTRLRNTRLSQTIANSRWDYGNDATYLRSLVDYWRDTFDWRAQERKLNERPQFKRTIDGIDV
jgi:hypothetical protein